MCITMCSLVMSLFLRDYIKTEIEYQQCDDVLKCVQYSHSAWFLDGRTSILVIWSTFTLGSLAHQADEVSLFPVQALVTIWGNLPRIAVLLECPRLPGSAPSRFLNFCSLVVGCLDK